MSTARRLGASSRIPCTVIPWFLIRYASYNTENEKKINPKMMQRTIPAPRKIRDQPMVGHAGSGVVS